jgi:hypothetical protein
MRTLEGKLLSISRSGSDTVTWHSAIDFKDETNELQVKIVPIGRGGEGQSLTSSKFMLDNKPPTFAGARSATPYLWRQATLRFSSPTDLHPPFTYFAYLTDVGTVNLATPSRQTSVDSLFFDSLVSSSTYKYVVRVADSLGNTDTNTVVNTFRTTAVADYKDDRTIGSDDLADFITSWTKGDMTRADLADADTTSRPFPYIRVKGDKKLNLDDLYLFSRIWYYDKVHSGLPKLNKTMLYANTKDRVVQSLKKVKNENQLKFNFAPEPGGELIAYGLRVYYDPMMKFDSVKIDGNGIKLVYCDTINGILYVDYAKLEGFGFTGSTLLSGSFYLRNSTATDSIVLQLFGYDREIKEVLSRTYVYKLNLVPTTYALYQNYPNPFNSSTTIEYDLPENQNVRLIIYDILGREVKRIVDETREAGYYRIRFDASGYASGAYFCRMKAGDFTSVKKMLLIK